MRSLPFSIEDLNGGFMKVEGILRVEDENLVFEFQKKDAIVEAYQSEVKSESVSLNEIAKIDFKRGWFSDKLILHGKRASSFKELPGKDLTERILKIKKKQRELAASVSSKLNLLISEKHLRELDDKE